MSLIPENMQCDNKQDFGEPQKPLRLMLLGKTGAGKSLSGNTILGRKAFMSDMKLGTVTDHCKRATGTSEDVPLVVIDTPGLFETYRKQEKIVREILQSVTLQSPGPHAFVVVVPLGRMTQEDEDTNTLIETMFGPRVWDYTIVLFTHGDRLEGKTINDVITDCNDNLRNFIRKCSGGFHVFDNKNLQETEQLTGLLAKIQTLVALNGGGHYRSDMYPKKERKIRKIQKQILAGRSAEIQRMEKAMEERHKEQELEEKKNELWRREDMKSRVVAETEISTKFWVKCALVLAALFVIISLVCWEPQWLLGCILPVIWAFPTVSAKISVIKVFFGGKKTA